MSRSSSKDRVIQAYPRPKYNLFARAYASVNEMSLSETVEKALREMYERMPEGDRVRLMHQYENPMHE
jgi:hypothetical protein